MVLQPLTAVDSARAARIANDFKRMKRSDALSLYQRHESAAFSPSFMLAFLLLAKRALLICKALRAGRCRTAAFPQQASQDCEAKSMGQPESCRKPRRTP